MSDDDLDLDEFAEMYGNHPDRLRLVDALPEPIKDKIRDSDHPPGVIEKWLRDRKGIDGVTWQQILHWRERERKQRSS